MTEKFIPIATQELVRQRWNIPSPMIKPNGALYDHFQRPLEDLRISVTDRCNFRCTYCMPKEIFDKDYVYLPQKDILRFEEIIRIAKIFVAHGVKKIRLTGGEPLLRKNIEELIHMLSELRTTEGEKIDLTLTTNGALLARKAQALKAAGLTRITVSLDALDDACFRRMNDAEFPVQDVLDGIQSAQDVGFENIKINMVVKAGVNDQEIIPMARYFKDTPHALRFIEYMDVGASNAWKLDEVLASEIILQRLQDAGMPLIPIEQRSASETARRWRHQDSNGEIGFISSVSQAFCRDCSRVRLSTQGMLYTCLFATQGHDLRSILRNPALDDDYFSAVIRSIWEGRNDRYSELRGLQNMPDRKKIEMSYIGG